MSKSKINCPREAHAATASELKRKTYEGRRDGHVAVVTVDGRPLDSRLDLWNHSQTGFEWGYGGSGPAQLALALLADYTGSDEKAVSLHQKFKRMVVAGLPRSGWKLTAEQIGKAIEAIKAGEGEA